MSLRPPPIQHKPIPGNGHFEVSWADWFRDIWQRDKDTNRTFLDLSDTPSSFSGEAYGVVTVNAAESALVFTDMDALIVGTANEVEVSYATGVYTIGLPDDVTIGNDLTVTNDMTAAGLTLTDLTASTVIYSDASKVLTSLANGTGWMHNNGSGTFTWNENLSFSVETGITASTTQSQGQQPLTKTFSEITTVGNDDDVVTMPSASAGKFCMISSQGANLLQVYPASGDNFEGLAANASLTMINNGSHGSATGGPGINSLFWAEDSTTWQRLDNIVTGYRDNVGDQYEMPFWDRDARTRLLADSQVSNLSFYLSHAPTTVGTDLHLVGGGSNKPTYISVESSTGGGSLENAYLELKVANGGGDAYVQFNSHNTNYWLCGMDRADNIFKIQDDNVMTGRAFFEVDTSGRVSASQPGVGFYAFGVNTSGLIDIVAGDTEYVRLYHTGSGAYLDSNATGSGTTTPLILQTGGVTALTIDTSQNTTLAGNLIIPDAGNIGSASDTDAIAIAAGGGVTLSSVGPHAVGGATDGTVQLYHQGTFTSDGSSTSYNAYYLSTTITGVNGDTGSSSVMALSGRVVTQNNSETIDNIDQLRVEEPNITNGTDIITTACSLRIPSAPTEGSTGNYAILVDSGDCRFSGDVWIGGSNQELRFYEGANYVGFEAPALGADQIWVLPSADGNASEFLQTDGAGNLTWAAGGSVTFGADNQIPYTNNTTDDFDYSANLTFDGSTLALVGDMTINAGGQVYKYDNRANVLTLQAQTSGTYSALELFSADGDGTDNVWFQMYGIGTPGATTNTEKIMFKYDNGGTFHLEQVSTGSGSARAFHINTDGSSQIVLNADGSTTMTGDLTVDTSTLKVDAANNRVGLLEASPSYPVHGSPSITGLGSQIAVRFDVTAQPSAGGSWANYAGFYGGVTTSGANAPSPYKVRGFFGNIQHSGTMAVAQLVGLLGAVESNSGSGAVTDQIGAQALLYNDGGTVTNLVGLDAAIQGKNTATSTAATGIRFNFNAITGKTLTLTNAYGIEWDNSVGAGTLTITNFYGLYFPDMSSMGSTISRAIHTEGGDWVMTGTANFGVGTATFDGSADSVIAIANGTEPGGGTANQSYIYAKDVSSSSEMFVMDEAGNATQISPHDPETGEWYFYSENVNTGRRVRINLEKMVRDIEAKFKTNYIEEWHE